MNVKCPRCKRPVEYSSANPHRPFCSERCQMIDLGAWAEEKYRVPLAEIDPNAVNENADPSSEPDDDYSACH